MQNIVTLGEINDALQIAAVTAAQLADMGFAPLDNKPICEALPTEQSRRLRNAKLYPADSIGQIRVAIAKRLAAPATCLLQIQEPSVWPSQAKAHIWDRADQMQRAMLNGEEFSQAAQPQLHAALFAARGALQHLKEGGKPTESLLNEAIAAIDSAATPQAAPAAVAVPDEREAFEAFARKYGTWDIKRDDVPHLGIFSYTDVVLVVAWHVWQARAALAATPAAPELHREWRSAFQEAIDTMEAEIDSRADAENVRRMKRATSVLRSMLAATPAAEPFGYFKAEPFGWTDCGPDDEGAIALYEKPQVLATGGQAQAVPHQQLTSEIERVLCDPDSDLSLGAQRALNWCLTWVSVPLQLAAPQQADTRDAVTFEQRMSDWQHGDALDAERYRWLRSRDLETISQGGVFAGMTPQNVILNEEDLDQAVDASIAAAKGGGHEG